MRVSALQTLQQVGAAIPQGRARDSECVPAAGAFGADARCLHRHRVSVQPVETADGRNRAWIGFVPSEYRQLGRQRLRRCGIPSAGGREKTVHCGFLKLYCGARCFPPAQSRPQKAAAETGKGAAEEGHAPLQKCAETRRKRGAQARHRQCHVAV